MTKTKLLIVGIFITFSSISQDKYLFEKKNISEVRKIENEFNSLLLGFEKTNVAENYFPGAIEKKDYFPLTFKRTNDDFFPELQVEFFYEENDNDSTIICTSYDWEIMKYVKNIFEDSHIFEKEKKREKEYLKKYDEIKSIVIEKIGQPDKIDESKGSEGYFYKLEWFKEEINVLVLFSFSTKLKSIGDGKIGSYRIRLKIDYK